MFPPNLQDTIHEQIAAITQACSAAHNITPDQLSTLRATENKAAIVASDDLKCFTRCATVKSGFLKDGVVDVERVVAVSSAFGKDATKVRANAARCQALAKADIDCNDAWELYQCFHS